jgi:hypothetical protein
MIRKERSPLSASLSTMMGYPARVSLGFARAQGIYLLGFELWSLAFSRD